MYIIIIFFIAGILIGWVSRKMKNMERISGILTMVAIALLLFLLGYEVGNNEEIRKHINTLGLTGFIIALFSVAGSIFLSWIYWKLFYVKK